MVNLGLCKETTVEDDMNIARRWFRVEVDEKQKLSTELLRDISFNTYLCGEDEMCTDIDHCYEAVPSATMVTKFCDKGKVCCKNKGNSWGH